MPSARDAREWVASGGLHGIGDSLYTPFRGRDGEEIDWDAYGTLVRYCVGDLEHPMLWLTSGVSEWWSLTMDERKRMVEVAIEEARAIAPATVIQVATIANAVADCVELTNHAAAAGADICYIQTPPMEAHGGDGVLRFFRYVADRTDIALGIFPSPSSSLLLTPQEVAHIANTVPAVCAMKEGHMQPSMSMAVHALAPTLYIWECNTMAYTSGWLQKGIVSPAQLATSGYLKETPDKPLLKEFWARIWAGHVEDAVRYASESGFDEVNEGLGGWLTTYPGRAGYLTHWGEAFKYAASVLGLPPGEYPYSRPPQAFLPEAAKEHIRSIYERVGLAPQPVRA